MNNNNSDQEPYMKTKNNLRFLLALGNTKVVVLKDEHDLQVYANTPDKRFGTTVAPERLTEALATR